MVAVLIKTQKIGHFCENCDHDHSPNKDSKIRHFCKDCDDGRSPQFNTTGGI